MEAEAELTSHRGEAPGKANIKMWWKRFSHVEGWPREKRLVSKPPTSRDQNTVMYVEVVF